MNSIALIAKQEIRLNLRNRWVLVFAGLFTIFTLGIAYFGMVTAGFVGFQDFRRTAASLVNLIAYLVPLFALLMGVFSFISNREYLELMVTQPVTRPQIVLGKYTGLFLAILGATLIGFGFPGLITTLTIGAAGASRYFMVVFSAVFLSASFLSLSLLLVIALKRRVAALGTALGVWFFFIVFYDLMVLASTLYLDGDALKYALVLGLFFNPVDIFRVMSLIAVGGTTVFGPAGATLVTLLGSQPTLIILFTGLLLIWIVVPLSLSLLLFKRQNLT